MLTGTKLFSGETISETLASVIKDEPALDRLPAETPEHIRWLLHRCLTKDPTERLRDIGEARIAIDHPKRILETSVPMSERGRFAPWIAAAAASLLVGAVVWSLRPEPARAVVRFVATPPSSAPLNFVSSNLDLAISPDGTRIVYAASIEGRRQLVVRALDRLETTLLTGGLGASPSGPFFSPDGQWVGYVDNGALRKISIHGGPSEMICELRSNNTRGASWGDDGTIVFAEAGRGRTLARVFGRRHARSVDAIRSRARRTALARSPSRWRRGIVHERARWDQQRTDRRPVARDGCDPHPDPIPALTLTTCRRGTSSTASLGRSAPVAFDLERLEVTSDPISVFEGPIVSKSGGLDIAVARDGSLAYITDTPSCLDKNSVWVDRQGREERLAAPARLYLYLRLSPDGTRIALDIRTPGEDVWVWDLAGETLTRLSLDPGADISPIWTPDGGRIVFASGRPNNLVWTAADGTGSVEPLAASTNQQRAQTFSPDGKHLIFWERHPDRGYDLHRLSLDGERSTAPLLATEFNEMNAEISPDGRFLAYQSDESGRNEIYVRPFPNVEQGKRQVSTDGGTHPLWACDGRELFHRQREDRSCPFRYERGSDVSFENAEVVVEGSYDLGLARAYDVSLDGERFLMLDQGGSSEVELVVVLNWGEELKRLVPVGAVR